MEPVTVEKIFQVVKRALEDNAYADRMFKDVENCRGGRSIEPRARKRDSMMMTSGKSFRGDTPIPE